MKSSPLTFIRNFAPIALLITASGCGDNTAQSGAGGLSPDDARALEEAAANLDAKALPPPAPLPAPPRKSPPSNNRSQNL